MTQLMLSFMIAALVAATWQATLQGQESAEGGEIAWTAERAKQELKVRPKDSYIQFVVSQLSPQERVENFAANGQMELRRLASRRARGVDLFSIFSGGLAIQESLQLDTLTGQANSNSEEATVKTSSLEGPAVKSHPWTELLDGRDPAVSLLASCVPADQLFVRFQSVGKLLDMRQLAEDYATYVTTQSQEQAYSMGRVEEIQRQLALEVSAELQPVYEAAVAEIAITSSDLYFAHGNDVTLLMRLNEDTVIRAQLDAMLDRAARSIASAVTGSGEYLGVPYRYVVNSDRRVCVYSAYPKP
ncbi:MAG: hypothetical protein NXI32_30585, partial [bacterium]|nr:hypothetical protein [bacterium]